jgi:DNA-binding transcriptional ArsR family regulator
MSEGGRLTARAYDFASAAELDKASVRVARSPLPTVFTLTRDALQNGRRGTPPAWRVAVRSRLRQRDAATLAPLTDPKCRGWPGLLTANEASRETLDDALERVVATPGVELLDALESDPDVTPADLSWDPLRRDPDRWLRGYVDAIYRGWQGIEPLWRRSETLLEREADRIDAATDRGVPATQLITELGSRASLAEGQLRIAMALEPRRLSVPERGVILSPMIAAGDAGILASPGDVLVRIAYSAPGAWRAFDDQAPPPASLEALLGVQRARLMRRLDRSHAAGELAAALGLPPSGLTFHLRSLEAAGLIVRERRGRHVIVQRSERGTVLLALYESG